MRTGLFLLLCGLSTGCGGAEAPAHTEARPHAPEPGGPTHTATAKPAAEPVAGEPTEEEPIVVHCKGTVLSARESPQNKRFPDRGGHWIVEIELEEWSAEDDSPQPSDPLRLIVPREVIEGVVPRPVAGERVEAVAARVAGKPDTARAQTLSRLEP